MLGWALLFFLLAVAAAVFGFGGLSATFAGLAQILFVIFIVLFLASIVFRLIRGGRRI